MYKRYTSTGTDETMLYVIVPLVADEKLARVSVAHPAFQLCVVIPLETDAGLIAWMRLVPVALSRSSIANSAL